MSAEAVTHTANLTTEQPPQTDVSRRALLRAALWGGGAILTAPVLAACGDPYELPDGGHPSVYTPPREVTGQRDSRTPDAAPSADVDGARTPEPEVQSPDASPTAERIKPEIAGHKLEDLKRISWGSTENTGLANSIRKNGQAVQGDPGSTGTDPDYYRRAVVLGVPADEAKSKKVRLAVALQDPSLPGGNKVVYVTLPKGTVVKGGQEISLMPTPTTSARVHPYRLRLSSADVSAAFMTSADGGKTWKVVAPHVITPSTTVGNGTYSNAHVL